MKNPGYMSAKSVSITYFLDVTSSWCVWAEPAWAQLKADYADRVDFAWKIALIAPDGFPKSRAQCEWFYRRSGTITRSAFMLNSGWYEAGVKEYLTPNLVAEAAKDLGLVDDRVRLAIARAGLVDGKTINQWDNALAAAATIPGIDPGALRGRAQTPELEQRVRQSTAEFHSFKMTQRPAFLLENNIGDRAAISGLVSARALGGVLEGLLDDATAYRSYAAHHGAPPPQ